MHRLSRTESLIGVNALNILRKSTVLLFGIGGVGSYTAEALARSGIGKLILIDNADIDITNLNRQIHATINTVGKAKVDAMKERLLLVAPEIKIECHKMFITTGEGEELFHDDIDYVVDAVDTVSAKIAIVEYAYKYNLRIVSSMGAGNKLDPKAFMAGDIFKTSYDPLARVMRRELRKRGIDKLKVVYSTEKPKRHTDNMSRIPASISFVPSTAGLIIAGEVVNDLIAERW